MTSPTRPSTPAAAPAAAPSRFGGGFMGGIMGGLLGAGIGAMLFGGGFFSGLGSFAGILGFILQIAIVAFLVHMAVKFFRNRNRNARPAYAGPAEPLRREGAPQEGGPMGGLRGALGGLGGGGAAAARPRVRDELNVTPADYAEFERLLGAVQTAYAAEDQTAFRTLLTPEMQSYFADELAENAKRGVANRISDVRLLQGDLSESWREGSTEYATVAMRFSLIDVTVERASGRVVEGNPNQPTEATELWTFVRQRGGQWILSAIQQAR